MTKDGAMAAAGDGVTREFIDGIGRVFAEGNFPEIAGRIFGALVVAVPAEQTVEEIMEATGASRASVSTMTRFLITAGMVEQAPKGRDRRIRYRLPRSAWTPFITTRIATYGRLHDLSRATRDGMEAVGQEPPARLKEMTLFFAHLRNCFTAMMESWPEVLRQHEAKQRTPQAS